MAQIVPENINEQGHYEGSTMTILLNEALPS